MSNAATQRPANNASSNVTEPYIMLRHEGRDTIDWPEITRNGTKDTIFKLVLGSKDDDNEEARAKGIPQPRQAVPKWVVDQLEETVYFRHLKSEGRVSYYPTDPPNVA